MLKRVMPFHEWLGNYSSGFGIPLCCLANWRIIRNRSSVPIGRGTPQTWRRDQTRHVTKDSVNHAIRQHRLQIFGKVAAVTTLYMIPCHRILVLALTALLDGTEWQECNKGQLDHKLKQGSFS